MCQIFIELLNKQSLELTMSEVEIQLLLQLPNS